MQLNRTMTSRQCEIAAEAYAASLLARAGYDVLVQYGANQPHYDLVAVKGKHMLPISVKGSQDGGWMLAVKYKTKERTYHEAIDVWLSNQREDVVFFFVQFAHVPIQGTPRVYVARCAEVAQQLKLHRHGHGYGSLQEDRARFSPKSTYTEKIPDSWRFSIKRMGAVADDESPGHPASAGTTLNATTAPDIQLTQTSSQQDALLGIGVQP